VVLNSGAGSVHVEDIGGLMGFDTFDERIARPAECVVVRMTQNATGTTVQSLLAHMEGR
jgi:hypothetical protein